MTIKESDKQVSVHQCSDDTWDVVLAVDGIISYAVLGVEKDDATDVAQVYVQREGYTFGERGDTKK